MNDYHELINSITICIIQENDLKIVSKEMLRELLKLTKSEIGFIGELKINTKKENRIKIERGVK